MTADVSKTVIEMVDERPAVDNTGVFNQLWDIVGELRAKIDARFELHPEASTRDLQPYHSLDGAAKGFLSAFSGPEVDWLVHSWIGNPAASFSNMHLSAWLGPQIRVPHFGLALGTLPDIFMYMDYVPRTDLMVDLDYLDKYYEPVNARLFQLKQDARFAPFVSRTLYMRQSQSHTSLCFVVQPSDATVALIREVGHEMLDRWIKWTVEAEPVPAPERAALAARDFVVRRTITERDPANKLGERMFGPELTNRLVRALWGGDRAK